MPGRDVAVEMIGARPGEKQHEELVNDDEAPGPAGHPGIVVATPPRPDPAALRRRLREMEALAAEGQPSRAGRVHPASDGPTECVRVPVGAEAAS